LAQLAEIYFKLHKISEKVKGFVVTDDLFIYALLNIKCVPINYRTAAIMVELHMSLPSTWKTFRSPSDVPDISVRF